MFDPALYIEILNEEFTAPLQVEGPRTGIWRHVHRWDDYIFNSPLSFHADPALIDLNPFHIEGGILSITPSPIPDNMRDRVEDLLVGDRASTEEVAALTHYTGMISLHDSWGETYGYYEVRARMPKGLGHWPALWLSPATKGWPPEIDLIEVKGSEHRFRARNRYQATIHFDGIDPNGGRWREPVPDEIASGELDAELMRRNDRGAPRWALSTQIEPDINIFDEFAVYGLEWTPDEVIWTFGATPDQMVEVFRTPTPADLHSPLYFIANTEVGGVLGGTPGPFGLRDDALEIDYVKVFARAPDLTDGTTGDDLLVASDGLSLFRTGPGQDQIEIAKGTGNAVIMDFSEDDTLVLTGFGPSKASQVVADAVQVGPDLWLTHPGTPFEPQTIILKSVSKSQLGPDNIRLK